MQAHNRATMFFTNRFSHAFPKEQIFSPGQVLSAHRHRAPYASLVITGHYSERSFDGYMEIHSGCLIIHPAYHSHANRIGQSKVRILNLSLADVDVDTVGYCGGEVTNIAALIGVAKRNPKLAANAWLEESDRLPRVSPPQWLNRFTARLLESDLPIRTIARAVNISHEHASRMCRHWYGMPPRALRQERCIRHAIQLLREGVTPIVAAMEAGFSDQPHLTRVLRSVTGITPGQLRKNFQDQVDSRHSQTIRPLIGP